MAKQPVVLPPIQTPLVDKNGILDEQWYRFFETLRQRTGGDEDLVAGVGDAVDGVNTGLADLAETTATTLADKASKALTITAGNGLEGGGDLSNHMTIDLKQDTGWTAGSGGANKGSFTSYGGAAISATYQQSEVQTIDNAVKNASQRVNAIEAALRAIGAIDG